MNDKVLKNYQNNNQECLHKIQSNAIGKRPKTNQKEKSLSEKQRIFANKRERERTRLTNSMFAKLASKFKPSATKQEVLRLSKEYLEFLYLMNNDEEFFKRYAMYDLKMGFNVYLLQKNFQP